MNTTQDAHESFLRGIRSASHVLPELEEKSADGHPILLQVGFQIAELHKHEAKKQLDEQLSKWNDQQTKDEEYVDTAIKNYTKQYVDIIASNEAVIQAEERKRAHIETEKTILKSEKQKLQAELDEITAKKNAVLHEIADAKKDLLKKCIQETAARIKEIVALNKELLTEQQEAALRLYQNHLEQNNIIKKDLENVKTSLELQQTQAQSRMLILSKSGITKSSSNFLISFGYLAILAAGLIFSIFTLKTLFGSEDAFSFIVDGLLQRAGIMQGTTIYKILQVAAILGIVALVSIICRSFMIHIKKRNLPTGIRDLDDHHLRLRIQHDSFYYSGKIRSGNWTLFILKMIPLIFIAGILIILLSVSGEGLSDELSTSMTGLLIGSCIAATVSGTMYVYVVKVIEPRFSDNPGPTARANNFTKHWEIIVAMLLFAFFLLAIIFQSAGFSYNDQGVLSNNTYIFLSLSLFLSVVFLGAISVSYGILYKSATALDEELRQKILSYTALIDQYNGPLRIAENEYFNKLGDDVVQQLLDHVRKKNSRMFNDNIRTQRTVTYNESELKEKEEKPAGNILNTIILLVINLVNAIVKVLEYGVNLLLPSEKEPPQNRQSSMSFLERKYFLRWEKEYFADLSGKLEAFNHEMGEKMDKIKMVQVKYDNLENPDIHPLKTIYHIITEAREEINKYRTEISYIEHCGKEGIAEVKKKYEKAKSQLLQGYQLGECLVENKLKPDISFNFYEPVTHPLVQPNGNGHKKA